MSHTLCYDGCRYGETTNFVFGTEFIKQQTINLVVVFSIILKAEAFGSAEIKNLNIFNQFIFNHCLFCNYARLWPM